MSAAELQRLAQDMEREPALRDKLNSELSQCINSREASALFMANGYSIEAGEILAGEPLSDESLNCIVGGNAMGGGTWSRGHFLIAPRTPNTPTHSVWIPSFAGSD